MKIAAQYREDYLTQSRKSNWDGNRRRLRDVVHSRRRCRLGGSHASVSTLRQSHPLVALEVLVEDKDLIAAWIDRQDCAAVSELEKRYGRLMYTVANAILGNEDDALDSVQESWLRAIKRLGTLRDAQRFRSWLCSIVRNVSKGILKERKKTGVYPDFSATDEDGFVEPADTSSDPPETATCSHEFATHILRMLPGKLTENQWNVLKLKYRGHKLREIAEFTGMNERTAESHLYAARKRAREVWRSEVRIK